MHFYCRFSRCYIPLLIAASLVIGCKNHNKSKEFEDGGPGDGGAPAERCEPEFSMLTEGGHSSIKEVSVEFDVKDCEGAEAYLKRPGDFFDPAVHLGGGRFRRYVSLQKGENRFTVIVATPGGEVEGPAVTFDYSPTVPEASPESGTITGTVVRATDNEPVADAVVFLRDVEGELTTGPDGAFQFPTPTAGRFVLTVEAEGHTLGQRRVEVTKGGVFQLGDLRLMPLDSADAEITPEAGGTLTSSAGDIELTIPAGAVRATRTISGISFPSDAVLPNALPDSSRWTQAFDLHPDGVLLQAPAELKLENTNGFAPGTKVPIGYYNRNTAAWEPESMGEVSDDGQWILAPVTHFSSYDVNYPIDEQGRPGFGNGRRNPCAGRKGSSIIDDHTGQLLLYTPIAGAYRNGETEQYSLIYNSARARPFAPMVLPFKIDQNEDIERIEATVDLNGARKNLHLDAPDSEVDYLLGTVFDGTDSFLQPLETGVHQARIQLAAFATSTYMSTDVFGAPGQDDLGVETREPVPFETEQSLPVAVIDESQSPFGAGWRFEKEERIIPDPDTGHVLWYGQGDFAVVPLGQARESHATFTCFTMYNNIIDFYLLENGRVLLVGYKQVRLADSIETAESAELLAEPEDGILGAAMGEDGLWLLDSQYALHLMAEDGELTRTIDVEALFQAYRDAHPDFETQHFLTTGAMAVDANEVVYVALDGYGFVGVDTAAAVPTLDAFPMLALPLEDGGDIAVRSMAYEASTHSLYLQVTAAEVIQKYDLFSRNETTFLQVPGSGKLGSTALSVAPNGDLYYAVDDEMGYVGPGRWVVPLSGLEFGLAERFGCFAETIRFSADGQPLVLCTEYGAIQNYPRHHFISINPTAGLSATTGDTVFETEDGYRIEGDFEQQLTRNYREFDSQGRLVRSVTQDGIETLTYGDDGIESYTSPTGYRLDFVYDGAGRLSRIDDSDGVLATLTVDASGDLSAIEDGDGVIMNFAYDGHKMVRRENPRGDAIAYQWDDQGAIENVQLSSGRTKAFSSLLQGVGTAGISDMAGAPSTLTEGDVQSKHWFDNTGRLSAIEYGGVRWDVSTQFQNNNPHQPNWATITVSGRDDETFELILVGDLLRSVAYNDEVIFYVSRTLVDENGDTVSDGLVESIADTPAGVRCSFSYDDAERVTMSDCTSLYVEFVYNDNDDLPDELVDYDGNVTRYTYDDNGNIAEIVHPSGAVERFERNGGGFVTAFEDVNGHRLELVRDRVGNPISVTDPAGGTTLLTYAQALTCDGCAGHRVDVLSRLTDPAGNVWFLDIREDNRLTAVTDPAGNTRTFGYDDEGRMVSMAGEGAEAALLVYNSRGNVIEEHIGDETVTHQYDARDRLTRSEDNIVLLTRAYDDDTHDVLEAVTDKETGMSAEVGWTAIPHRPQLGAFHSSVGHRFTADDDTAWHAGSWMNDGSFAGDVSAYWNSSGRVAERTVYNTDYYYAVWMSTSFDEMQRPYYEDYTLGVDGYRYGYCERGFDGASARMAELICTGDIGLPETATYTYDSRGWLTGYAQEKNGLSHSANYQYDDAGLMVAHTDVGTLQYDDALRLTATDRATYTYDARGTRTSRTDLATGAVRRYTYNASEQLVAVETFETADAATPTSSVGLTYDPQGRLFRIDEDGSLTYLLWLGDRLIAELDETGDAVRRYVPGEMPDLVSVIEQDGTVYYVIHDDLGTVHRVVDEAGDAVADYVYDPWGAVLSAEGPLAFQPRRFQGAYYLASAGLYYFRARFYDPEVGQFISEDAAVVLDTTVNRYRFADNNPVANMDPLGFNKSDATNKFVQNTVVDGTKAILGQNKHVGRAINMYDRYKTFSKIYAFATNDKKGNFKRGVKVFGDIIPGFADSKIGKKILGSFANFPNFTAAINAKMTRPRPPRCRKASKIDRMFLDQNAKTRRK